MAEDVYTFSNGVKLPRAHLLEIQIARYLEPGNPNVHEPIEEEWLLRLFQHRCPTHPVFLDVGAAIGYYSVLVKCRWPNALIFAVEPLPRHADLLSSVFELNGLDLQDLKLLRVAIGAHNGHAHLTDEQYGSMLVSEQLEAPVVMVPTRTLEAVLGEIPPVHLMKMDIQGAEVEVLEKSRTALLDGRVRHVVIGTHGSTAHAAVIKLLTSSGYEIVMEDAAPPMQPDGIVAATHRRASEDF